jgi:hypothetical protein
VEQQGSLELIIPAAGHDPRIMDAIDALRDMTTLPKAIAREQIGKHIAYLKLQQTQYQDGLALIEVELNEAHAVIAKLEE